MKVTNTFPIGKRLSRALALAWVVMALAFAAERVLAEPQPVAVVIGNSEYLDTPLLHCAEDARSIAGRLEEMGFRVRTHTNTSQNGLRRAVFDLERESSEGALAVFYFSGHAFQTDGTNYLAPIEARPQNAGGVAESCVALQEVFDALQRSGVRAGVVILDAARPHPARRQLGLAPGLAHISAPPNVFLAFSTKPGTEMPGLHDHVYPKVLAEMLGETDATIPQLLGRVKLKVRQRTADTQEPWDANALAESVYLYPQHDTGGRATRFLAPASASARALPGGETMNPRPVFALASADLEALASANSAGTVRPEGTELDLPLRGSGALWEKVFQTHRGRVNLEQGGTIYSHPSRQSQPLSSLPSHTRLHIVGYVRTREGIFWLPLTRYQEYMQGADPAWIFMHGTEKIHDFTPRLLVDSSVPDVPAPSPGVEEPVAAPVPENPGFVFSPFDSTRSFIDVRGYTPGTRVHCPYTGYVFRVP